MSAIQELQVRLQGTNALIARYSAALVLATTSEADALALNVNLRSLRNLANRLEAEFLGYISGENLEVYRYRLITGEQAPSLTGIGIEIMKTIEELNIGGDSRRSKVQAEANRKIRNAAPLMYEALLELHILCTEEGASERGWDAAKDKSVAALIAAGGA